MSSEGSYYFVRAGEKEKGIIGLFLQMMRGPVRRCGFGIVTLSALLPYASRRDWLMTFRVSGYSFPTQKGGNH